MREDRLASTMVLTVTEDTPADMLAGSMELLVQLPKDNYVESHRVTVSRSTPMMDLLVQIATAHKLGASRYTLQAIGERGLVLPHQPNTPIGALDVLQLKLLPKQKPKMSRKSEAAKKPFEVTFRLQVHLPQNQLWVARVSPKTLIGEVLETVCREKNLVQKKYQLHHPVHIDQILDPKTSLEDYGLQEVTLRPKIKTFMGINMNSEDVVFLKKPESKKKTGLLSIMFGKPKEKSVECRTSMTPRIEEQQVPGNNIHVPPPTRPHRKRRVAPPPPITQTPTLKISPSAPTPAARLSLREKTTNGVNETVIAGPENTIIGHSRNSSDSSGYHDSSVLSDNPDNAGRALGSLPRQKTPATVHYNSLENSSEKLDRATLQNGKNLAKSRQLRRASSTPTVNSTGHRKKRAAPAPPVSKALPSALSTTFLERIVDSEESVTSDMELSKPPSDVGISPDMSSPVEDNIFPSVSSIAETDILNKNDMTVNLTQPVVPAASVVRGDVIDGSAKTEILLRKVSETLLDYRKSDRSDKIYNHIPEPHEIRVENENFAKINGISEAREDLPFVDWTEIKIPSPPEEFQDVEIPIETSESKIPDQESKKEDISGQKTFQETEKKEETSVEEVAVAQKEVVKELQEKFSTPHTTTVFFPSPEIIERENQQLETEIEKLLKNKRLSAESQKEASKPKRNSPTVNFKITTYSPPKKLNIFVEEKVVKEVEKKLNIENEAYGQGELKSLQVLKSILPKLNAQPADATEKSGSTTAERRSFHREATPKDDPVVLRKKPTNNRVTTRSPSVHLSSWSERPKSHLGVTNNDQVAPKVEQVPWTRFIGSPAPFSKKVPQELEEPRVESAHQSNSRQTLASTPTTTTTTKTEVPKKTEVLADRLKITIPRAPPMMTGLLPIPPTITGVTLKKAAAKPKNSPPPKADSKDQLLESIRNFGGRGNLRSVKLAGKH